MLTKEKRTALIAGLLAAVMVTAVGCGNNQPKDKDEDGETRYVHTPVYIPANSSSGSTSSTLSTGIISSKPSASSAKVAAPASGGKTGISTGAVRSSAVS